LKKSFKKYEIRITLIYWIFSVIWIYASDAILELLVNDPDTLTKFQNYKGWFFVTVSALLIYVLVQHYLRAQREVEMKLIDNEERLRLAVDSAQQGIFDLNVQTGEIVVNDNYARMLGYKSKSFVDTQSAFLARLHPDECEEVTKAYEDFVAGTAEEFRIEFRQQTNNGEWIWVLAIGSIVEYDSEEKPLRLLGILTNITDIKKAERQIAQLYGSLRVANKDLFQAYDATIEGWSRAMDLRDHETEGHTLRVTELTIRLAQVAGLSEEDITYVRRGSLLHDMGKLGIPDSILHKPGPLDDDEWTLMRLHPVFAFEMLSPIKYLQKAMNIPYCHHEKWDGSGYPRGLKGEEIPIAARIFSVVDVYDALTSDRSYRPAWSKEKTLDYISSLRGIHFDPKVVDLFFDLIESEPGWLEHPDS
jgi:PAS domain S-box-containing protein